MTATPTTDPVQAAESAHEEAKQTHTDLLAAIRDGRDVPTEDLVAAEQAVKVTELRLDGARDKAANAAEVRRQATIDGILDEMTSLLDGDAADRLAQRLETFAVAAADLGTA